MLLLLLVPFLTGQGEGGAGGLVRPGTGCYPLIVMAVSVGGIAAGDGWSRGGVSDRGRFVILFVPQVRILELGSDNKK